MLNPKKRSYAKDSPGVVKPNVIGFVAQWNRARVSEARCRGFESLLTHTLYKISRTAVHRPYKPYAYKSKAFVRKPRRCVQTTCTASLCKRSGYGFVRPSACTASLTLAKLKFASKSTICVQTTCLQKQSFCVHSFANFSFAKVRKPNVVR